MKNFFMFMLSFVLTLLSLLLAGVHFVIHILTVLPLKYFNAHYLIVWWSDIGIKICNKGVYHSKKLQEYLNLKIEEDND